MSRLPSRIPRAAQARLQRVKWLVPIAAAVLLCAVESFAQMPIPPELESWRGWALQGQEFRRCPFLASAAPSGPEAYRCAWPERLYLNVGADGASFAQRWQVFSDEWVRLPGDGAHWPGNVQVDGKHVPVVARDGAPSLRLLRGVHAVVGTFTWKARPETLVIPPQSALVALTVDGRDIPQPQRTEDSLWLGRTVARDQPRRIDLQVYRLARDEIPVELVTRLRLQISGDSREEILGRALPDGFTPTGLTGPLPARLDPDGRLRIQARPGAWELTLTARGPDVAMDLARPNVGGTWARDEIWSFQANDRLRVATLQGAESIDPTQANVPDEWRGFPAYRMSPDTRLVVSARTRGLESADDSRVSLSRRLWLDFDHSGFTVVDRITGAMRRDWRLDLLPPYRLESAQIADTTLLVTESSAARGRGIELRAPNLDLTASARLQRSSGTFPATGWSTRFEAVRGELNLPPGHRLLAVIGADRAPRAWIESWGLWGLFGVLVIAAAARWIGGWVAGIAALLGLVLLYQEAPAQLWTWANMLAAIALARAAPAGKLRRVASVYRTASIAFGAVILLPLLWNQVRLALYPQLSAQASSEVMKTSLAGEAAPAAAPALRAASSTERYAPGALLQTGPGVPGWRYETYEYFWAGPVEPNQTVRFLYIGPDLLGAWRIAGSALLAALFILMVAASFGLPLRWPGALRRSPELILSVPLAAAAILAIVAASRAGAATTPDPAILAELRDRLTRPPECVPACAEVTSARVAVAASRMHVTLDVSTLATVAVPMPQAGDVWQLDALTVDGVSGLAMLREKDGTPWIALQPGTHTVRLAGTLARAATLQLVFPAVPRKINVLTDGWRASGVDEDRLRTGTLEFARVRGASDREEAAGMAGEFPAFTRVERRFDLGLDWSVTTSVIRVSPQQAALSVDIPLLPGESVLTSGVGVQAGADGQRIVRVGLERGQTQTQWSSLLARTDTIDLAAPAGEPRTEVWSFDVSPQWRVDFSGTPAVMPEKLGETWRHEFHPRAGERLRARVARPKPAPGRTFTIDSAERRVIAGKRSTDETLHIDYRSTQGGRHSLRLPPAARVTAVRVDGLPVPVRPNAGELSLGLLPGSHAVDIAWVLPIGAASRFAPEPVELNAPASNVTTIIRLPADRWPLLAVGAGVGPAVLYWAELVIFALIAVVIGRWSGSPLRVHEWLLLGLGLSTLSWSVFVLAALWLFAMRWRSRWEARVPRWQFNLMQIALASLSFAAIAALVFAGIRQSLLASPDMGIAGPGSFGAQFAWFQDLTPSALPRPAMISVPLWVYRALMFAWALWIAAMLLRWIRESWSAWKTHGIWRGRAAPGPA